MSAPTPRLTLRGWPLLLAILLLTAPAFADSITIGTVTFLGYGTPGDPHKAAFTFSLNTQGMTFDNHIPGMPYSLLFDVSVYGWDAGLFETWGPSGGYLLPPHFCPCEGASFNLTLITTGPFKLANGRMFYPSSNITATLYPLPGQTYLQSGQSLELVLNSVPSQVPEPGSLVLLVNGLLAAGGVVWWKRRH